MDYDKICFEFSGFEPDHQVKQFLWSLAEPIYLMAPGDSVIKIALKRNGDGLLEASCRVASLAGVFIAKAISDNPIRAASEIKKKTLKQLRSWRRKRFLTSSVFRAS